MNMIFHHVGGNMKSHEAMDRCIGRYRLAVAKEVGDGKSN